jgi:hypothetical protein
MRFPLFNGASHIAAFSGSETSAETANVFRPQGFDRRSDRFRADCIGLVTYGYVESHGATPVFDGVAVEAD